MSLQLRVVRPYVKDDEQRQENDEYSKEDCNYIREHFIPSIPTSIKVFVIDDSAEE